MAHNIEAIFDVVNKCVLLLINNSGEFKAILIDFQAKSPGELILSPQNSLK